MSKRSKKRIVLTEDEALELLMQIQEKKLEAFGQ
jgi:hypothetical protein